METVLSIIASILSVVSIGISLYTFKWTAERDRKQATLDAYNQLQEQALDYLNHYRPKTIEEIAEDPLLDKYKEISGYVARIEHFCVGVNQNIYDPQVVYELADGYLNEAIRRRIEPIINRKNRSGRDYYANIHQVYQWMEQEQAKRGIRVEG